MQRFWNKVDTSGDCWEWTASVDRHGYGQFSVGQRKISAHRFSALLHFGMFDRRLSVLHRCDNPRCVRPSHLFLGDQRTNLADMRSKGRAPHQAQTHCARGHERTPENIRVKGSLVICKPCQAAASRRYKERSSK